MKILLNTLGSVLAGCRKFLAWPKMVRLAATPIPPGDTGTRSQRSLELRKLLQLRPEPGSLRICGTSFVIEALPGAAACLRRCHLEPASDLEARPCPALRWKTPMKARARLLGHDGSKPCEFRARAGPKWLPCPLPVQAGQRECSALGLGRRRQEPMLASDAHRGLPRAPRRTHQ